MTENNNTPDTVTIPSEQKTIVINMTEENKNVIICEVCGHANPENTAICKMCSNYL